MATALGQLPSAVDRILLPDVWELFEHWSQWPPEFVLLRGFVGYEPPKPASRAAPEAAKGLTKYLGAAAKPPAHITEMVQWAEQMRERLGVKVGES